MAVVTDKIKSVVDFLVKGFEPRETIFDEMAQEVDEDYPVQDNLALQPEYSFQHLRNRKTIVLNLHLLDKEQSQRTIDFVCGAAHALDGKPQKVGDLVFVFTPSNVTLSVDVNANQNKFNDSLWRAPLQ